MDRAQLYKLTELIVAEVVRRIAQEERRRQHPEQGLVLLADSVSFPEKLQQTLNEQFGVAYTPVSIPETNTFADEALLYAGKLEPGGLLERVKEAKTVILVSPRLELLRRIASGDDGDPLSHLLVRAILWQKDVRVYLDYEPPRFRRNTFLADTAEAIDTLRQWPLRSARISPWLRRSRRARTSLRKRMFWTPRRRRAKRSAAAAARSSHPPHAPPWPRPM